MHATTSRLCVFVHIFYRSRECFNRPAEKCPVISKSIRGNVRHLAVDTRDVVVRDLPNADWSWTWCRPWQTVSVRRWAKTYNAVYFRKFSSNI